MASSTPNPWGGGSVGNWALEAERAEAEEVAAAQAAAAAMTEPQSFPSLQEAAKTKTKKKKGTTFSLSEFTTGNHVGPGSGRQSSSAFQQKGLTTDELLRLPTGPKERTPEELEQGRLGGGFRNNYSGGPSRRSEDESTTWGGGGGRRPYGGGFDDDARRGPPSRSSDLDLLPSRADEDDNWAARKRVSNVMEPSRRETRDRYQDLGGGGGGGLSTARADEVDNWSAGKKPIPSRASGFGFRDSSAADSGRWGRGVGGGVGAVMVHNGERERPRLVLDPPTRRDGGGGVENPTEPAKTRPSPFGAARPREEVLAEKGVDWKKVDSKMDVKKPGMLPGSSHSSRPSSANSDEIGNAAVEVKPRPKVNPFGDAKPREVLLEQKGMDWRKIDMELEHRAVDRLETEQEKLLKEEIGHLKEQLNKASEVVPLAESTEQAAGDPASLREQLLLRERELEQLIHDLDDKVRFGQKALGEKRPGSGGSRSGSISERPPSRSSLTDESRGSDFMERPGSRGSTGDMWSRPDERRGFRTGRDGGFLGAREVDRSRIGGRW